jgi:hypothetical protein
MALPMSWTVVNLRTVTSKVALSTSRSTTAAA